MFRKVLCVLVALVAMESELNANCTVYEGNLYPNSCPEGWGTRWVGTNWLRVDLYDCISIDSLGFCTAWLWVQCEISVWEIYECNDPCNGLWNSIKYEYYMKGIPYPTDYHLTNNRSSQYFTYADLTGHYDDNGGPSHYPCAFLDPYFLNKLDAVRVCYGAQLTLESGYRNPIHHYDHLELGNWSTHMYGQAVDVNIRVNGVVDCDKFYEIAYCATSLGLWVEPFVNTLSNPHVHFEVRPGGPKTVAEILADHAECDRRF